MNVNRLKLLDYVSQEEIDKLNDRGGFASLFEHDDIYYLTYMREWDGLKATVNGSKDSVSNMCNIMFATIVCTDMVHEKQGNRPLTIDELHLLKP